MLSSKIDHSSGKKTSLSYFVCNFVRDNGDLVLIFLCSVTSVVSSVCYFIYLVTFVFGIFVFSFLFHVEL